MRIVDLRELVHLGQLVEVQELNQVEKEYKGYEDILISHSCESMQNGYEANFCDDTLYYLTACESLPFKYMGWTYACGKHLTESVLKFAADMEKKRLDSAFDEWTDQQLKLEM